MKSRVRFAFAAATIALAVSGCSLEAFMEAPHGVIILNDLDYDVTLMLADSPADPVEVSAHSTKSLPFDTVWDDEDRQCTKAEIVISSAAGEPTGQIPPPACIDKTYTLSDFVSESRSYLLIAGQGSTGAYGQRGAAR